MKRFKIKNTVTGLEFTVLGNELALSPEFGRDVRWVREGDEDISGALETRQVDSPEGAYTEYKLPAEFSVVEENGTRKLRNMVLSVLKN